MVQTKNQLISMDKTSNQDGAELAKIMPLDSFYKMNFSFENIQASVVNIKLS